MISSTGTISYPSFIDEAARYLGSLRNIMNRQMNESAPGFKRGDRSDDVNILGVQGEMIFAHYLHSQGVIYSQCDLVSGSPGLEDIVIGEWNIDVKAIRQDAPDLLVNVDAHVKKAKGITHYAFVQVVGNCTARYWVFPHVRVSKWDVKSVRYSNAYFKKIIQ